MNPNQLEKAFRHHFGDVVGNNAGYITVNGVPPTEEMLANAPTWYAEALNADRIAAIKAEAGRLITERYPAWKQSNLTARFCELLAIGELSESEQAEKQALLGVWAWVKSVRAESDRLEADPNATPNWPQ